LKAVEHDQIAFRDRALDEGPLIGVLTRHALKIVDKAVLAIGNVRIVLHVDLAYKIALSPRAGSTG
jgi:hypothetical protein